MDAKTLYMEDGETRLVEQQWAAICEKRGTTVSSSAWEFGGTGALTAATLVTPLASVKLTPTTSGILKNTATLANGEVVIARRKIDVRDVRPMDYQ